MKKLIWLVVAFLFIFIIPRNILAANMKQTANFAPTPTSAAIDYPLPYPGILPDHPLYFLKVMRDRLLGWFIKDPVKKIEFDLLMADKRLRMGEVMAENGKSQLAISTVSKGEKYFMDAVLLLKLGSAKKDDLSNLRLKLITAVLKHRKVIGDLELRDVINKKEWQTVLSITDDNKMTLLKMK